MLGQITLAHAYEERLKAHDLIAAQVLVTLGDTEERGRYLNALRHHLDLVETGCCAGGQ